MKIINSNRIIIKAGDKLVYHPDFIKAQINHGVPAHILTKDKLVVFTVENLLYYEITKRIWLNLSTKLYGKTGVWITYTNNFLSTDDVTIFYGKNKVSFKYTGRAYRRLK